MLPRTLARLLIALVSLLAATIALAATVPVRTGTVDTPDGQIYYEVHGEGSPIFLVAGGPGAPRTSLMPEFDVLADHHAVVYFDNIGRGRSSDLPAGRHHSPERDAMDIERLRVALGYDRIMLLGHSYGGYPALAYAGRFGEHLSRLVISDSGYGAESWQRNIDNVNRFVENQYPGVWADLMAMRARGVRSCSDAYEKVYGEHIGQIYWYDLAKAKLRRKVSDDPRDRMHQAVYCDMLGDDAEWTTGGAMAGFDARPALAAVHVPTLVTVGRHDIVCPPAVAEKIAGAFPPGVARVRIYEHSAHRPWVEEGDTYFTELRQFLDGPQGQASLTTLAR